MSTYANQPQEIFSKDPNINPETVEYNELRKAYFPKQNGLYQCILCGWVVKEKGKHASCGNISNFLRVNKATPISLPAKGPIAHLGKHVIKCWNPDPDPNNATLLKYHDFDEKTRLVVNLSTQEAHQETYCANCGRVYGWPSGRAATPSEIQDAKDGKIPLKTTKPVASEVD
jgi:hypothetical protein